MDIPDRFPGSAELVSFQIFRVALSDPITGHLDLSKLKNCPKVEQRLFETGSNHSLPITFEQMEKWSRIVEDLPDLPDDDEFKTNKIFYTDENRTQIAPGFINMMVVLARIFNMDENSIFKDLNESNIHQVFENILKKLVGDRMKVKVFPHNRLKSVEVKGFKSSRKDLIGTIKIEFSYKNAFGENNTRTMSIEHTESHACAEYDNEIDISREIEAIGNAANIDEFPVLARLRRYVRAVAGKKLSKEEIDTVELFCRLITGGTVPQRLDLLTNLIDEIKKCREEIPKDETRLESLIWILDYVLSSVDLEDPVMFESFMPYLLYSEKFKYLLNGLNLNKLYYQSKWRSDLENHWESIEEHLLQNARLEIYLSNSNDDLLNFSSKFKSVITTLKVLDFDHSREFAKNITAKLEEYGENIKRLELVSYKNSDQLDATSFRDIAEILKQFEKLPTAISEISFQTLSRYFDKIADNEELIAAIKSLSKKNLPGGKKILLEFIAPHATVSDLIKFGNVVKDAGDTVKISLLCRNIKFSMPDTANLADIQSISEHVSFYGSDKSKPVPIGDLIDLCKMENFALSNSSFRFKDSGLVDSDTLLNTLKSLGSQWKWKSITYEKNASTVEIGKLLDLSNALENIEVFTFRGKVLDCSDRVKFEEFIRKTTKRNQKIWLEFKTIHIDDVSLLSFAKNISHSKITFLSISSCMTKIKRENIQDFIESLPIINRILRIEEPELQKLIEIIKGKTEEEFVIDLRNPKPRA